jgi:hypothetical protein
MFMRSAPAIMSCSAVSGFRTRKRLSVTPTPTCCCTPSPMRSWGQSPKATSASTFPPSDPEWRGASSDRFLAHAVSLVAARGGRIAHLDATILCETPKIGPHADAIRKRIAEIAGIDMSRVSIKATTTEGLGFLGRGEGIAAMATATVRLPWSEA